MGEGDCMYYPKFTEEVVDNILDELSDKIRDYYRRPGRMIDVDFDEVEWYDDPNSLRVLIIVYVNGEMKRDGYFQFTAYDEYYDDRDFDAHVYQAIHNFIKNL